MNILDAVRYGMLVFITYLHIDLLMVHGGKLIMTMLQQVRATSHKPDEIYGIIERLSPGTRKVELFGRPHNIQPNWLDVTINLNYS